MKISGQRESFDQIEVGKLQGQNNKNQRLVRKYYGPVKVIHKVGKGDSIAPMDAD